MPERKVMPAHEMLTQLSAQIGFLCRADELTNHDKRVNSFGKQNLLNCLMPQKWQEFQCQMNDASCSSAGVVADGSSLVVMQLLLKLLIIFFVARS